MKRFWSAIVLPILNASAARHIVEIGAFRGDNSRNLARWCAANGAVLSCIDPAPAFDTAALEAISPGQITVHRALSLTCLAGLLPADVVLVDGDHNWHTVFHEIQTLYGSGSPIPDHAPIAICHDVGWPYGRRDMYYEPATLPDEARQPHRTGGLSPYDSGLTPNGLNGTLQNACHEGGPRNGVRTAIEDAIAPQRSELEVIWFDLFFGLAVIVPKARLATNPELAATLRAVTPSANLRSLMRLAEKERIDGLLAQSALDRLAGERLGLDAPSDGVRPFRSALPEEVQRSLQHGSRAQRYRGRMMQLNPLDMANLLQEIGSRKPGTIFEIGVAEGGRTLWLADTLQAVTGQARVVGVDLVVPPAFDDPRITFLQGDATNLSALLPEAFLEALPRPWIVIEDASHFGETTAAVLSFFDSHLRSGDSLVVEDGGLSDLIGIEASAVSQVIARFLSERHADYAIAEDLCDRFGYNATGNPNGWLRRR